MMFWDFVNLFNTFLAVFGFFVALEGIQARHREKSRNECSELREFSGKEFSAEFQKKLNSTPLGQQLLQIFSADISPDAIEKSAVVKSYNGQVFLPFRGTLDTYHGMLAFFVFPCLLSTLVIGYLGLKVGPSLPTEFMSQYGAVWGLAAILLAVVASFILPVGLYRPNPEGPAYVFLYCLPIGVVKEIRVSVDRISLDKCTLELTLKSSLEIWLSTNHQSLTVDQLDAEFSAIVRLAEAPVKKKISYFELPGGAAYHFRPLTLFGFMKLGVLIWASLARLLTKRDEPS